MNNSNPCLLQLRADYSLHGLMDFIIEAPLLQAITETDKGFAFLRELRFSVRMSKRALLDKLATSLAGTGARTSSSRLLVTIPGAFVHVEVGRNAGLSACECKIWSTTKETGEKIEKMILELTSSVQVVTYMFSLKWYYMEGHHLESALIEEEVDTPLADAAYPSLQGGVSSFIDGFLTSESPVLVLQGPPGTGKTRLIRAILGEMARRWKRNPMVYYTSDMGLLQADHFLMEFLRGNADALVIEDADHLLQPRGDGNRDLHRILVIADGVARSRDRKLIFSTNLRNLGDLDEALLRPGRCYARVHLPNLTPDEVSCLVADLVPDDQGGHDDVIATLPAASGKDSSLAQVYEAIDKLPPAISWIERLSALESENPVESVEND